MSKRLTVVNPSDPPPDPAPPGRAMTITEAAASGSVRDQLVALRARVAKAVEDPCCPPRDLAALSRRLIEIGKEIAAIDAADLEEEGGAAKTPDEPWSTTG
jgi:hypothetical protein